MMSDRFEDMMTELMVDLWHVQSDEDAVKAIIEKPEPAPEAEVETEAYDYHIDVQSQSSDKIKQYSASHLSSSKQRNFQLLQIAVTQFSASDDDVVRAAIREMIDALLNAL